MIFKLKNIFPQLKTLKQLILSVIIFIFFAFSACSDDPVTPQEPEFDPPRFNWRSMEIPANGFAGIWAKDTGNIFLLNNYSNSLYKVADGIISISLISSQYYLSEIKGVSNNEIYLFGSKYPGRKLSIVKWNGGGFEFFDSEIDAIDEYVVRGCVVNSNEVWAASKGGIIKYDGNKLNYYSYEEPSLIPENLFFTYDHKIKYIASDFDTAFTRQSLFEYQDTGFVQTYNYYLYPSGLPYTFLTEVGGYTLGLKFLFNPFSVCIENFNGTSFSPYFCYNRKIRGTWAAVSISTGLAGINPQNFMLLVQADFGVFDPYRVGVIHWNGVKESAEIGLRPYNSPSPFDAFMLYSVNQSASLILCPYSEMNAGYNTLLIGTLK